jgi:hypothetical protein
MSFQLEQFGEGFDVSGMEDPKETIVNLLKDELFIVDDVG